MNFRRKNLATLWPLVAFAVIMVALASMLVQSYNSIAYRYPLAGNATNLATLTESHGVTVTATGTELPEEIPAEDASLTETAIPIFLTTQMAIRATVEFELTHRPPTRTPVTGIGDSTGPVVNKRHVYENAWKNYIDSQWTLVRAGSYQADSLQGIVAIGMFGEEVYETPSRNGSVHIVAEDNYRLTLLSTDGTTFYFDIPGRRFVNSLTEVVPTITPTISSPTPTSTVTPTFNPTWLTPWPTCTPIPPSTATREPCGP